MNTDSAALIRYLEPAATIPAGEDERRLLLRALMNLRAPQEETPQFWRLQDAYLQKVAAEKGIVGLADLPMVLPNIHLWQGDITRLQVGAIVNAANNRMLGCFQPLHRCIDNAIHSQAGLQLRLACAGHMAKQGHAEPTGKALITPAYNLPADYVIHTVGPIIRNQPDAQDKRHLADCYRSCLTLAVEHGLSSIAFCCISTGEYRFPNEAAARIAIATVREFLAKHPQLRVVFNVFKDIDLHIYRQLLTRKETP